MSDQPLFVAGIAPGITVRGLDRSNHPIADWLCACGTHERGVGRGPVRALLARARVGVCDHPASTPRRGR